MSAAVVSFKGQHPKPGDMGKRLVAQIKKGPGCWRWLGHIDEATGYGYFHFAARTQLAHRVSYEFFVGPIPDGAQIDHVVARGCKFRDCVNPAHLEPVTSRENTLRGVGPSAVNARRTHCVNGHLFDEENTYITPKGYRFCRACRRQQHRQWRASRVCCPECGREMRKGDLKRHRRGVHRLVEAPEGGVTA